jgi:hypothetical protein
MKAVEWRSLSHRSFKVGSLESLPKYPAIPSPVPEAVHVSLAQNDEERVLPKGTTMLSHQL